MFWKINTFMRIHEIINEDISRRGFLKGAGAAAAGMAGASGAKANIWADAQIKPGSPEDRARKAAMGSLINGQGVQGFNRVYNQQLEIERARD